MFQILQKLLLVIQYLNYYWETLFYFESHSFSFYGKHWECLFFSFVPKTQFDYLVCQSQMQAIFVMYNINGGTMKWPWNISFVLCPEQIQWKLLFAYTELFNNLHCITTCCIIICYLSYQIEVDNIKMKKSLLIDD